MSEFKHILNNISSEDLEETILGAILSDNKGFSMVSNILTSDSFYYTATKATFRAMLDLFTNKEPIDLITVVAKIKELNLEDCIGGSVPFYCSSLTDRAASSANIEYHARLLKQQEITRKQLGIAIEIQNRIKQPGYDVFDMNDRINEMLRDCNDVGESGVERTIQEIVKESIERMENAAKQEMVGISSGLGNIDSITMGWQAPDYVVIAARPGMGKTALALAMARHIAREKQVLFVSREMKDTQLIDRIISQEVEIAASSIRSGKLTEKEWSIFHNNIQRVIGLNLKVNQKISYIEDIVSRARYLKSINELDILFIDYIQLLKSRQKYSVREQEISYISRLIKELCIELDIPAIILSQLSRSVESRGGAKMPILSDLRESGAIEQDADIVAFLHRPEYYKIKETDDGKSTKGLALLNFAKHRSGSLGDILLKWTAYLTKFTDYVNQIETEDEEF